jgi:putative tryptophan/tyrosine transport system substrate-binding protein
VKRREFISLLGGAAAWPVVARAQRRVKPLVGYFSAGAAEPSANVVTEFRKGLGEAGYVEGQNVQIEYRWANNQHERLQELAADLVRRQVAIIATPSSMAAAVAAKATTTTIPIVFGTGADPVKAGLVVSLNRPGGNVTGVSYMNVELVAKRLGLLQELVPGAARFAVLVNPSNPLTEPVITEVQAAAIAITRSIEVLTANNAQAIDAAFASLIQKRVDALLVSPDILFSNRRVQLVTLAARHVIPAIYYARDFAEAGGLMSYASRKTEREHQVGVYVGRILKGEKPADLPVLQPTRFELVINLQTAKLLGIDVPQSLLARADEVIE